MLSAVTYLTSEEMHFHTISENDSQSNPNFQSLFCIATDISRQECALPEAHSSGPVNICKSDQLSRVRRAQFSLGTILEKRICWLGIQ